MRDNILAKEPKANLAVYSVWLPELGGTPEAWSPTVLPDRLRELLGRGRGGGALVRGTRGG